MSFRLVVEISQDGKPLRRIGLDRPGLVRLIRLASVLVLLILGTVLGVGVQLYSSFGNGSSARAENVVLRSRLRGLEARQTRVDQALGRIAANDSKIRQMTREDQGAQAFGIGPLSALEIAATEREVDSLILPGQEAEQANSVDQLRADLDDMEQRSEALESRVLAQERSLLEVRAYLDDRTSILRASPTIWPVRGWLTSRFGWRNSPHGGGVKRHTGVDIAAPIGTPVIASADGHVVFAGYHSAYGNLVVLDHGYGMTSKYAHTSKILTKVGERVQRGDLIARVGNTGRSTGPHLHFEVAKDGVPTNPLRYLRSGS